MRRKLVFFLMLCSCLLATAQTDIERMRSERKELERQIASQEKILTGTETSISSELSNLKILEARLDERTRILNGIRSELSALTRQQNDLEKEIVSLEKEYEQCSDNYADACVFFQRQSSQVNALAFVLASASFREMTTRIRYLREYSSSLVRLAGQIQEQKDTLEQRRHQVEMLVEEKRDVERLETELQQAASKEKKQQQQAVDRLKKKRNQLKKEISAQQKRMNELSKEIDRQIQLALRAEKGGQVQQQNQEQDFRLTGSFESNKGKLPMPISGPALIVGKYGISQVAGQKDVKQNNLGIDIQGNKGASALCVFDGKVSGVFQHGKGQIGILVRHGKYITVYCNLVSTSLKKGDDVKAGDEIGVIQTSENGSPVLHFQLHKESTRLNPQEWLRK